MQDFMTIYAQTIMVATRMDAPASSEVRVPRYRRGWLSPRRLEPKAETPVRRPR